MTIIKGTTSKYRRNLEELMKVRQNAKYTAIAMNTPSQYARDTFYRPAYGKIGEIGACYAKVSE